MNIFGRSLVLLLSAGSVLGVGVAGTAHAAGTSSMSVSYQDLNPSNPADARVLYARLQRAASAVCHPVPAMDLARHAAFERCYDAALSDAVNQVNAPQVLALYRAETGSTQHG
jgi:UrcA family protein